MKLKIKSIAKINFGLRILRKRKDGMHDLHTLFLPLDNLFDEITFEKSSVTSFHSNIDSLSYDNNNLIFLAHKALEAEANKTLPLKISLKKSIPMGGGLGGGSSNGAAALIAVNKLFELNIQKERLKELALSLGADVPFFLYGKPAIGKRLGEVLEPFHFPSGYTIAIVNPGIHVSTADAFSRIKPIDQPLPFDKIIREGKIDFSICREEIINDFEKTVFEKHPEIEEIKNAFYSCGADFSLMSGTGSTVYGIFEENEKAGECLKHFPKKYFIRIIEY